MNYRMAGLLPGGASYEVNLLGPMPAWMLGKIIGLLELYRKTLEEDENRESAKAMGDLEVASWLSFTGGSVASDCTNGALTEVAGIASGVGPEPNYKRI